jgi:hypothetical protein
MLWLLFLMMLLSMVILLPVVILFYDLVPGDVSVVISGACCCHSWDFLLFLELLLYYHFSLNNIYYLFIFIF